MSSRRPVVPTIVILVCLISVLTSQAATADSPNAPTETSNTPAVSNAATVPSDPFEKDVAELSKVLGIPIGEMRADLARQELVGRMNAALRNLDPSLFGGLFVDYEPAYQINILVPPGKSTGIAQAIQAGPFDSLDPFIQISETTHTEAVLVEAMDAVARLSDAITASDIDLRNGLVLVYTDAADVDRVRALVESASLPIPTQDVHVEAGGFIDELNSYGGLRLSHPNGDCTSGFSVSSTVGLPDGVSTAAHCPDNGVTEQGVTLTFVDSRWGGDQDVEWLKTPGMTDINAIWDGTSNRQITSRTGRSEMFVSQAVCRFGVNGGRGCTTIVSVNANPGSLDPNHTYNNTWIRTGSCGSLPGDSGGPYYFGNAAFGTHKGKFFNQDCVFMAQNFMSVLNIRVKIH